MHISRRGFALASGAAALIATSGSAMAVTKDEAGVAAAVEALRVAIIKADKKALTKLLDDKVVYVHSAGNQQSKAVCIDAYTNGKSTYKKLDLTDHVIQVAGTNAVARHTFAADIQRADGKVDSVKIGIMQVWKKEGGAWKLLARQGYKI
ncbi:MAG: nuclear transport factor 2 family protein [Proteobacteria bacterium]|nr:nuclear transport factor 2 family protein [Pseudomonadota bacterium]